MWRHVLMASTLLLAAIVGGACGAPETAALPTLAPLQPAPAGNVTAEHLPASGGSETATPVTTSIVAPDAPTQVPPPPVPAATPTSDYHDALVRAGLDPTQVASCEMEGLQAVNLCAAAIVEPPPALPLEQALPEFTGRLVLYMRYPGFLMLGDADSGASLWLNGTACAHERTISVDGEWSADGQFIAFSCQDNAYQSTVWLLDIQTGALRQLIGGIAVGFKWAPQGHRLLVAAQSDSQRGLIVEAETGAVTTLAVAPLWKQSAFPPRVVGPIADAIGWYIERDAAAMAWSPDGAQVAVIADQIYVLDANPEHAAGGTTPTLQAIAGSSTSQPGWSSDGRFLYMAVPHQNHNNPLAPSSMYTAIGARLELSTGTFTTTFQPEPIWSPDGTMYVALHPAGESSPMTWELNRSDGTRLHVITDELMLAPRWAPNSQLIVFEPFRGGRHQTIVMDMKGQERLVIENDEAPSYWQTLGSPISPDGALLALTGADPGAPLDSRQHVIIYALDGQEQQRFDGTLIGWQPLPGR